jgi:all-trans-retinol 13,14-reductase
MIQSYKKNPTVANKYDVIIIGSGMGSLTTAAILAKEGKKVLVLERHYTAGGFTHVFKRKGFEWDVGIHYIGEVQKESSVTKKLFDYISDAQIEWADMGNVYDKIIIGNKEYEFVKGVQNFKDKMVSYFPDEKKAIYNYVNLVFAAVKTSQKFYKDKTLHPLISKCFGGKIRKPFYKFSDKTTHQVLSGLTNNQELIKVLTGQYGDYGLPPKQSSFIMHAAVAKHYFAGGSFPVGGSSVIANTIDKVIEKAGGTILISAEVDKILIKKNKARGVKMKDGKVFEAKHIVSGAGIMTTYQKLLCNLITEKYNLPQKLQKIKRSVAHTCLYIGLNGTPEELNLPKTNYWIYPDKIDHDTAIDNYLNDINADFPVVYISFPSAKDPDWNNRYPNKSTIDIITLLPYNTFKNWENTRWMKRGEDYNKLKETITKRLLDVLYKHIPQVKGKIEHYELSTPLTTKHFINYDKGEIYGLDHTPKRFRQRFLRPRTPIKNLYLTGQDTVTAGVAAALFSGVITSSALTGKNIIKKVMEK